MKIVLVGAGKIGAAIAESLIREGQDITVVDVDAERLSVIGDRLDIMTVEGNGSSCEVLKTAGVEEADLLIAATPSDETNLLICLIAKKTGAQNTIARVRNPEFSQEISLIQDDLGLGYVFNPEMNAALDISRILRFPSALKIDTFAKGRVELVKVLVEEGSEFVGKNMIDLGKSGYKVLVCVVERGDKVYIPDGSFVLQAGDRISVIAGQKETQNFFKKMGVRNTPARRILIMGATRTTYYLARIMLEFGCAVSIVDSDEAKCNDFSDLLPRANVIHGDMTDHELLIEEGLTDTDAFITLTGLDEQNIMMSLYASTVAKGKVITKITRNTFGDIVTSLNLNSVIYPPKSAAETICSYVRALVNSLGSGVETLYQIAEGRAEALEFRVTRDFAFCDVPLKNIPMKTNLLICSINRSNMILTPRGDDVLTPGDRVVVVTTQTGLDDLNDILDKHRSNG